MDRRWIGKRGKTDGRRNHFPSTWNCTRSFWSMRLGFRRSEENKRKRG
nr:MAG TPA: hypothetical protein [Caudoviricetes sp.]